MRDDGLVVHDPYGAKLNKGYLRNDMSEKEGQVDAAELDAPGQSLGDWGEHKWSGGIAAFVVLMGCAGLGSSPASTTEDSELHDSPDASFQAEEEVAAPVPKRTPPNPKWVRDAPPPCEDPIFDGLVQGHEQAVLLPRCDVPEGSLREWAQIFDPIEGGDDYPNGPPDRVLHRACPDGRYEQQVSGLRTRILRGRLVDGKAEGPFVFEAPERGNLTLEAEFSGGLPYGRWAWENTEQTVAFPPCVTQKGEYHRGARQGSWAFSTSDGAGGMRLDASFVEGQLEGSVRAEVAHLGLQGVWEGAASENERDGRWVFLGKAELEGLRIEEQWEMGKLVSREVSPGPCEKRMPHGGELCAFP